MANDNIAMPAPSTKQLKIMINEPGEAEDRKKLEMNLKEIKILKTNDEIAEIKVKGKHIRIIRNVIYSGATTVIPFQNRTTKEINRRIIITWNKFWNLKGILENKIRNHLKSTVLNVCVVRPPSSFTDFEHNNKTKKLVHKLPKIN